MANSESFPHALSLGTPDAARLDPHAGRSVGSPRRHRSGEAEAYFAALMQGSLFRPPAGPAACVPADRVADRPTHAGPWTLGRVVGRGGTAVVYAAHLAHPALPAGGRADEMRADAPSASPAPDSPAVVKLARAGLSRDTLACFETESRLLPLVRSGPVVRLYGSGHLPDGRPYLAIERVRGEPVTRHARRLTVSGRLAAFRNVCTAVAAVHRRGVVHCDLKPGNILVTPGGRVKLLDFGIAHRLGDAATPRHAPLMTPDFAAPEQFLGTPVSLATDVYSLGLVLHDLLCGRRRRVPWGLSGGGETVFSGTLTCVLAAEPDVPGGFEAVDVDAMCLNLSQARLDWRLEGLLRTALQTDPDRRYATAADLGTAVEHVLGSVSAAAPTAPHSPT